MSLESYHDPRGYGGLDLHTLWSVADGENADELRCAARHLAIAALELARAPEVAPAHAARFAAAEAQFRVQAEDSGIREDLRSWEWPRIVVGPGEQVGLTILFASTIRRDHLWLLNRAIDRELVHGAKELLCALRWHLPGELE